VPFVIYSSEDGSQASEEGRFFDETSAQKTGFLIDQGHTLMGRFIKET
jgi:hypothetical protein